eukprot:scaffold3691_cov394-Prasinococcus_capsulatus_cf.AAC.11
MALRRSEGSAQEKGALRRVEGLRKDGRRLGARGRSCSPPPRAPPRGCCGRLRAADVRSPRGTPSITELRRHSAPPDPSLRADVVTASLSEHQGALSAGWRRQLPRSHRQAQGSESA